MKKTIAYILLVFALLFIIPWSLWSNRLLFESSTGTVTDFDLNETNDSKNPTVSTGNISSYGGSAEYWSYDGFIGRLVYQGEPNPLYVNNVGPTASNTSTPPRFYYTRIRWNTGTSDSSSWREVFFTARVKGEKHNGGSADLSGTNFVIENPGDSIDITVSSGENMSSAGETAYNSNGDQGTYNSSTGYIYAHPYKYLWIDFTAIRTTNRRRMNRESYKGYYQSFVQILGEGVQQVLSLEGYYDPYNNDIDPDAYSFSIERLAPDLIPFQTLITHTTYQNSLLAGSVRYHSTDDDASASVGFYSDSLGTDTDFQFTSQVGGNTVSFPYSVVFDPVLCGNKSQPSVVSSTNNSFETTMATVSSVIDTQSSYENVLTGDVRIFVNSGLNNSSYPAATYSSIIYAIVTTD
ncbi:MAG: hypothetical protein PQJ47_02570 [Sphaerochaetaceae bacterium]|nr:hypothetical protein [Sphaerochaetaceae bacterium]